MIPAYYRPMVRLSWALDHALWGPATEGTTRQTSFSTPPPASFCWPCFAARGCPRRPRYSAR